MLRLFRRPPAETAPSQDEAVRLLLESPLNDADAVAGAFGGLAPSAADVHAVYLDVEAAARPRLSLFLDPDWYLRRNPDVAAAGIDPYLHFLSSGLLEGRDPHPLVDLAFLRAQLPHDRGDWDLAGFAQAVRAPQYRPHPLFDTVWYLQTNADVREAGMPALEHYLRSGGDEGRAPNRFFDAGWYCSRHVQAPAGGIAAFLHFVEHGDLDGLAPGPDFDGAGYRRARPALDETHTGSLAHFLREHPDAEPTGTAADLSPPAVSQFVAGAGPSPSPAAEAPAPLPADTDHDAHVGSFDAVEGHTAMGWAWHARVPGERLLVEIIDEDDQVVGRGRADGMRADLCEQGIGDGAYHFAIRLSPDLADGREHRLHARVAGVGAPLNGEHCYRAEAAVHPFDLMTLARTARHAAGDARLGRAGATRLADASLRLATGQLDEAVDELRALEREYPDAALVQIKLAEVDLLRGRHADAGERYRRAAGDERVAAWAELGLGNALLLTGDRDGAEAAWARGLALDPALPPLQARLQALRSRSRLADARRLASAGDLQQARRLIASELLASPEDPEVCELALRLHAPAATAGEDPAIARARRALVLLETAMAQRRAERGQA